MSVQENQRATRVPSEFVYFIWSERLQMVKIGMASNPHKRLASMQTGSADRLRLLSYIKTDAAPELESRLHYAFWRDRMHGEWFHGSRDILEVAGDPSDAPADQPFGEIIFAPPPEEPPVLRVSRRYGESDDAFLARITVEARAAGLEVE